MSDTDSLIVPNDDYVSEPYEAVSGCITFVFYIARCSKRRFLVMFRVHFSFLHLSVSDVGGTEPN